MVRTSVVISAIFFSCIFLALGQEKSGFNTDNSLSDTTPHHFPNPKYVALASAVIPGSGQIINRQYWKAPVIYAGFGILGYFIIDNNKQYLKFRDAYRTRIDKDTTTFDAYDIKNPAGCTDCYSTTGLLQGREYYRRNRDLSIIILTGLYAANILDAYVFANLREFDVSKDLSMRIQPVQITSMYGHQMITTGITLNSKH